MGEIAEMMLDGTMDPETGEWNFDGEDGPGFPMTGAEAEEYKRSTGWRSQGRLEPRPLRGDWSVVARWVADGRESRKAAREALGWSKRKLGGVVHAMEMAGLMATGGPEFWMTERGLAAMRATR